MANIAKLMKQAAQLQQQMEKAQAELAQRTVEASSGGGAVKVVARCDGSVQSIKIDPQAITADDPGMLEDMILSAVNSALTQAKDIANAELGKLTSGFQIPGMR